MHLQPVPTLARPPAIDPIIVEKKASDQISKLFALGQLLSQFDSTNSIDKLRDSEEVSITMQTLGILIRELSESIYPHLESLATVAKSIDPDTLMSPDPGKEKK